MVNSIREASSPLRIACSFLGLCLFDYEKFYLNCLYMIMIWTVYACAVVHTQVFFLEKQLFTSTVGLLVIHSNAIITLITALSNAGYKKTSDKCFKALCIVDDTLKSLGVSLEYQTVRRYSFIILTLLLITTAGLTVFTWIAGSFFYPFLQSLYIGTLFSYPVFLLNVCDYYYWIVLRTIEDRFDRLNRYVDQLSLDRENHRRFFAKNTCFVLTSQNDANSRNDQYKLWIIMQLHLHLRKTSREMNRMFGAEFGLQMGAFYFYTIEIISFLYVIYVRPDKLGIKKTLLILSTVLIHLWHLAILALINCVCENIHRKSNAMEAVLTNFINTVHDVESCQQVHQFVMQVRQNPLQFTAVGFCILGYKCLFSMFASIWETVIIMIQLGGIGHANYTNPENDNSINDFEIT